MEQKLINELNIIASKIYNLSSGKILNITVRKNEYGKVTIRSKEKREVKKDVKLVPIIMHPEVYSNHFGNINFPQMSFYNIVKKYYGSYIDDSYLPGKIINEYTVIARTVTVEGCVLLATVKSDKKVDPNKTLTKSLKNADIKFVISNMCLNTAWDALTVGQRRGLKRKRF